MGFEGFEDFVVFFVYSEYVVRVLESVCPELLALFILLFFLEAYSHHHSSHVTRVDESLYKFVSRRSRSPLIKILEILDIYIEISLELVCSFGDNCRCKPIFSVIIMFLIFGRNALYFDDLSLQRLSHNSCILFSLNFPGLNKPSHLIRLNLN